MPTIHRNPSAKSGKLTENEERELRATLLMVVGALDARPAVNVDLWDALGRRDADVRHPTWLSKLPEVLRTALEAGRAEGPGSLAATVHRVHVFFAHLEAMTLLGFEALAPEAEFTGALVAVTERSADVTVCASRALHDPTEANLEALRFAAMESEAEDEKVLDLASRRLAQTRTDRQPARQLALR